MHIFALDFPANIKKWQKKNKNGAFLPPKYWVVFGTWKIFSKLHVGYFFFGDTIGALFRVLPLHRIIF